MRPARTEETHREELPWASLCHLSALAGFVIPFGHIIGPAVLWHIWGRNLPLIAPHVMEVLNFQISVTVYAVVIVAGWVGLALAVGGGAASSLVALGLMLLFLFWLLEVVKGAHHAARGKVYAYRLRIRFLR